MLRTFDDQLEAKKTLTRSQAAAATRFFNCFLKFLHHHHHNEDGEHPYGCAWVVCLQHVRSAR
jgi:hypothetical protein